VVAYAEKVRKEGARNVLVSLAGEGAVLIDETGTVHSSPAPEGKLVNSVGAGDSMVAGFLAGFCAGGSYERAFRMGICAGSASAFSDSLPPARRWITCSRRSKADAENVMRRTRAF